MIFSSANKRGRLIEVVPEGSPIYERESQAVRLVKKSAIYAGIASAVTLALVGLYKIDQRIERDDAALLEENLHNARVVIPQMEANHNYRDSVKLENAGWTYRDRAMKGEFRAPMSKLDELAKLLNSNNTIGDNPRD